MQRIGWEIHYSDSTVYTPASGLWDNSPSSGVLIVVEIFDGGHKLAYMGDDYYYMDPTSSGTIGSYLEADKDDYSSLPASGVKTGNWATNEIWAAVHANVFGA